MVGCFDLVLFFLLLILMNLDVIVFSAFWFISSSVGNFSFFNYILFSASEFSFRFQRREFSSEGY